VWDLCESLALRLTRRLRLLVPLYLPLAHPLLPKAVTTRHATPHMSSGERETKKASRRRRQQSKRGCESRARRYGRTSRRVPGGMSPYPQTRRARHHTMPRRTCRHAREKPSNESRARRHEHVWAQCVCGALSHLLGRNLLSVVLLLDNAYFGLALAPHLRAEHAVRWEERRWDGMGCEGIRGERRWDARSGMGGDGMG
jgi:hypothetical protein